MPIPRVLLATLFAAAVGRGAPLEAQENYEIQVYPAATADKGSTFFELHSNWTGTGRKTVTNGLVATDGAVHETLEITHGFTHVFEVGVYVFTSAHAGDGWQYVGSHIRPRIRVPDSWKWPVGVSLSSEFGWVKKGFDTDEWSVEVRPIVDQKVGRFYWALNPAVDWAWKGPDAGKGAKGMTFSPNVKLSWEVNRRITAGVEYYGLTGTLAQLASMADQEHLLYPAIDLFLSEEWEFNAGVGFPLAGGGDHSIIKVILGRRFPF